MKFILILSVAICITFNSNAGWPQSKGGLYIKVNQWWVVYDQFYNEGGSIVDSRTRSIGNTSLYAEYGITDRFTAILYFPFFSKATLFEQKNAVTGNVIAEGDQVGGIGDSELTLKYGISIDKPVVITTSLIFGLPLGESDGGYDGSLQTGDGEFNQMLRLDVSGSFGLGKHYPYFSTFGAYNRRTNGFSDEYRLGMEFGIELGLITPLVRVMTVQSMYNGSLNASLLGTYLSGNNSEYTVISPELIVNFTEHWGIAFNYAKPLSGQLFFAKPSYAVGFFIDLETL